MARLLRHLSWTIGAAAAAVALFPAASSAATVTVCASGCAFTTIQAGIDAAAPGDTVSVGPGSYAENLVVAKPLTLRGAGQDETTIVPAVSNPNCGGAGGGSICSGASVIVLVQASDVTVQGLTLDGDNPALTSGVAAGGADLDARDGVITDYRAGVFDNLTVTHVTVKNVYLRGIYAASGGTFSFTRDRVSNVQADYASIAMFNFGGAGVMADNTVSNASDAISSNHSRGVQFLDNTVTSSGSGVHTDNAGDGGGSADLIAGNRINACQTDGYGIFVFVPYLAPTVRDNRVSGCTVGLAAFGEGAAVTTAFSGNRLNGAGASSSSPSNSVGVFVTTDQLGYGAQNVTTTFTGNTIRGFPVGVHVEQTAAGVAAAATLRSNVMSGNGTGAEGLPGTTVDAQQNWWGCPTGPNTRRCDTATGTVTFTPWLTRPPFGDQGGDGGLGRGDGGGGHGGGFTGQHGREHGATER